MAGVELEMVFTVGRLGRVFRFWKGDGNGGDMVKYHGYLVKVSSGDGDCARLLDGIG